MTFLLELVKKFNIPQIKEASFSLPKSQKNAETFFLSLISPEKLAYVIKILNNSKGIGPESTSAKILEDIVGKISVPLYELININSLQLAYSQTYSTWQKWYRSNPPEVFLGKPILLKSHFGMGDLRKFAVLFQNTFYYEHIWKLASGGTNIEKWNNTTI